jgi:adenylate kinase
MKLIFIGPPGAGKGTLAVKAADVIGAPHVHISTGAIFRFAIEAETPLGLKVKAIIDAGKLVDDQTTIELVKERLAQDDAQSDYILDGFPRNTLQAEALAGFAKIDKVVNFEVSKATVLERLSGRRVCRQCGVNYHVVYNKTKEEGVCDACSGEVHIRTDDQEDTVIRRYEIYHEQTAPLIEFYRKQGLLVDIDAGPSADEVLENLKKALSS